VEKKSTNGCFRLCKYLRAHNVRNYSYVFDNWGEKLKPSKDVSQVQ